MLELDSAAFVLTCVKTKLKLALSSRIFISTPNTTARAGVNLQQLADLSNVWFMSSGQCQVQFSIERDGTLLEHSYTLEHIAQEILSHAVWSELCLCIELEEVRYEATLDEPNLFFVVEHKDKSQALLAPPAMPAAQFHGVHCHLNFIGDLHPSDTKLEVGHPSWVTISEQEAGNKDCTRFKQHGDSSETCIDDLWDCVDRLLAAAIRELLGVRKRHEHIQRKRVSKGLSLLDVAPAVWNANYLKHIAVQSAQISTVSRILASYQTAHTPLLRSKINALVEGHTESPGEIISTKLWQVVLETTRPLRTSKTGVNGQAPSHDLDDPSATVTSNDDPRTCFRNDLPAVVPLHSPSETYFVTEGQDVYDLADGRWVAPVDWQHSHEYLHHPQERIDHCYMGAG